MKPPQSTHVVVRPIAISRLFLMQAHRRQHEVGALLLGRLEGPTLYVEDLVPGEKSGTSVRYEFTGRDFERASNLATAGRYVVGAAHGHPGYSSFLSSLDKRHQWEEQQLFPDFVSLVLDPFRADGIQFKFFRVEDEQEIAIPHSYGRPPPWNEKGKPLSPTGTKKRSGRFDFWLRAAGRWARKR